VVPDSDHLNLRLATVNSATKENQMVAATSQWVG
jgi:hypothetical protein